MLQEFYRVRLDHAIELLKVEAEQGNFELRFGFDSICRFRGLMLTSNPADVNFYLEAQSVEQMKDAESFARTVQRIYPRAYGHSALDLIWLGAGGFGVFFSSAFARVDGYDWISLIIVFLCLVIAALGLFEWIERVRQLREFNRRMRFFREMLSVAIETMTADPKIEKIVLQHPMPDFLG